MKQFLKRLITPGSFASSIATLSSGTGLGQLIMFVSSPILMRLYEPAIFGDLAILVSLTVIMATVFTLRFEMAIPLPEEDKDAHELIALAFIVMFGIALLTTAYLAIFFHESLRQLNLQTIDLWIFILPFTVICEAVINILGYWFIRKGMFLVLALSRTFYIGSMVIFQMILAPLTGYSQTGLIIGFSAGQILGMGFLLTKYLSRDVMNYWGKLSITSLKHQVSTYRQFPLFASWNSAFNTIARQIPTVILGSFFTKDIVGQYSIALRMLNMPFSLIGNSVGQVYYQRISKLIRSKLSLRQFTYTTMLKAGGIIVGPLLVIVLWGPYIFRLVLGQEWSTAGTISQILVPIYLVRFMVSPVSNLFAATQTQHKMMGWQLALALVSFFTFYLGGSTGRIFYVVSIYSVLTTLLYLVLGGIIIYTVRQYERTLRLDDTSPGNA